MAAQFDDNYPDAGVAFLRFAATYWTFKVLLRQLDLENLSPLVGALLDRMDSFLMERYFSHSMGRSKLIQPNGRARSGTVSSCIRSANQHCKLPKTDPILIRDKKLFKKK